MKIGNSRGVGLIESLAAAAVVSIAALGLGMGLQKMGQTRNMVRAVSTAIALESSLQTAIQDSSQYNAIASALLAGSPRVPDFQYRMAATDPDGNEIVINLPINQDVFFDSQGQACNNCQDWFFKIRIQGERKGATLAPIYAMAYRFEFNTERANLSNLGSLGTNFQSTDYKWMVPVEAYSDASAQSCQIGDQEVIVTGINRETGQVNCLRVGSLSSQCGANEVATGWVYESDGGGQPTRTLRMGCKRLNASGACPNLGTPGSDYAAMSLAPASFEGTPRGSCVFVAQASQTATHALGAPARSATFDVCPPHYRFRPSPSTDNGCTANVQQTHLGWQAVACPAGQTGQDWVRNVAPASLVVNGSISGNGQQVTCTLTNDQQMLAGANNWAGYAATLTVNGTCVLDAPEVQNFTAGL